MTQLKDKNGQNVSPQTTADAVAYSANQSVAQKIAEFEQGGSGKISAGGSWMSLGTSVTAPGTYQEKVMSRITFTQHINKGTSGHFMGGGSAAFSDGGHADTVINVSADFFTIEYGINDWGSGIALGNMNDFTRENSSGINTSSFYYGYRQMIDRIYTVNPNAVIILCTPRKGYKAGTWSNFNPEHWWDENRNGNFLKEYADAVIEIAKYLSLPVCDWFNEGECNQTNLASLSIDVALHPNEAGYKRMAALLVETFKKAIPVT